MPFKQITIIGTGLLGGSFGLALKTAGIPVRVVGCDHARILDRACKMGAIDAGVEDPIAAVSGSDLVVLATPVGVIIDLIERIGPVVAPGALITDLGSTKHDILERARAVFGSDVGRRFLGGHPMAGKEHSGISSAEAGLFRNATWFLVPSTPGQDFADERICTYCRFLDRIGAHVVKMEVDPHDKICAWISHLPQMISTAMAGILMDEFGENSELQDITARGLREVTRTASSPYSMWRDIAHTNTENIQQALSALEQRLAYLRENLRTQALREEFERANSFGARKRVG